MSGGDSTPKLSKSDLEELLHSKVDSFKTSALTAPGENYGSTMLLVDVMLPPDCRKLSIAAKLVPASPHMRKMFNIQDTVRKEISMYLLARPELCAVQRESGIPEDLVLDVIPKCYGARTTRNGDIDLPVDESSAILLENLKASGYQLVDRIVGMDLKHTEHVVTRLARLQATAIAIKLKKPSVFKNILLKTAFYVSNAPPPGEKGPIDSIDALSSMPLIAQHKENLKAVIKKGLELRQMKNAPAPREPFATLVHDDLWTNNIMVSYSGDGNISGLKILDFQSVMYGSPAIDLLFFLFTSTNLDMTKKECDRFIQMYYHEFVDWLELLGCDTKPFSYRTFLDELKSEGFVTFVHVFFMLRIICLHASKAPDLTKPSEFDRIFTDNSGYDDIYFKKTERLVKEFMDRNWI
ncbi:uncharacterized protein LOC134529837 [Bacillus rossius redtenbacheri]|uniref:uncharacterized protein LOC134529837 n=1 Tax=Bacillus rossius redtenbacheri TaxID=93214 RepID=UPI002FDCCD0F